MIVQSDTARQQTSAIGNYLLFDPETRPPKRRLPKGTCDAQIHLFGAMDRYPLQKGAIYAEPTADFAASKKMHKSLGVDRCLLVQSHMYGHDHECMLDALAEGGDAYRGCALIDDATSERELRNLHDAGVRGARFNFYRKVDHVFDADSYRRSIERIAELGWYAKVHPQDGELDLIEDMVAQSKVPVLLDHLARPLAASLSDKTVRCALRLLRHEHVWMMISNPHRFTKDATYTDVMPLARAYLDVAPDRCVWGTDWPHPLITTRMPNDGEIADFIIDLCGEEELQAVLVDNPARLFGF